MDETNLCYWCTEHYVYNNKDCAIDKKPVLYLEIQENSYVVYCIYFKPTEEAKQKAIDG